MPSEQAERDGLLSSAAEAASLRGVLNIGGVSVEDDEDSGTGAGAAAALRLLSVVESGRMTRGIERDCSGRVSAEARIKQRRQIIVGLVQLWVGLLVYCSRDAEILVLKLSYCSSKNFIRRARRDPCSRNGRPRFFDMSSPKH